MPDIQNNFVQSKMNQDLDDRLIPPGQYRSAQNVAISRSQGEDVGALENIEGNNLIANSDLASISHLDVIGYFVDTSQNNVYLFYTDYIDTSTGVISNFAPSTANCFIYRFNNEGNGTFTKLVEGSFLNFSKNSPIYGISMIEDLLFFTDYRNQPRKINVTTAAGDNTYYQNEDQISVAKFAPVNPVRFVDMAYNNKLKSTISNPSQEFLPINMSSTVVAPVGSVTTATFTAINGTTYVPTVGSKIISQSNANLNGKIVLASPAPTSTAVAFTGAVTLVAADDISFAQPNPDYDSSWSGDPDYVKDRFIRFSYRFKFDDGEYSIMAPFSQSCFVPKQSGYFILNDDEQTYRSTVVSFMENNATQVDLNIEMPYANIETNLKVTEVEILYKESDQIAIKSVESIPITVVNTNMQANANSSVFTYKYLSTKPYKVLPEDQTTRVYDKVPVRAFSQETSSNRIIYGNFIDRHSSPDSLTYGLGFANKEKPPTVGALNPNNIYSQIEYPNHTLKQNRNYQLGVVLADRYGRSSTTILSSKDVATEVGSIQYGNSTIYVPYTSWASSSSTTNTNEMYKWPGYSLSVLFNNKDGFTSAIPTLPSNGYPGTYVPIGAVGSLTIALGGSGYSDANNVATTGGTGSGLTVDVTVTGSAITGIEIAKMGQGYTDGDTITVTGGGGNATATITLAEPNLLGWYSYKFVVRQTEQDYYNVYAPGILNGYPDFGGGTSPYPTNELNNTAQIVLINDNINKVPRDLSEVGPEQRQFRSSVQLFGIVENTQPISSSTSSVQYNFNSKSFTVNSIATASDLNMAISDLSASGAQNFYQLDTNPLIARMSTSQAIGAVSTNTAATSMLPQLAVLETEAVESALDIYWETTTTGLVEDLNLEVKQASGNTTPVALSSTTVVQNENMGINANVFGTSVSPINAINSAGVPVINQSFSIISVTKDLFGGGTTNLLAKDVSNNNVSPFNILTSGAGFHIQTNGFFDIALLAAENNFNLTVRATDTITSTFVDFTLNWTLGNTLPSFGTTPTPASPITTTGAIANSDYSVNAVNGTNSGASLAQKQEDLIFSIAADTVENSSGAIDASGNNYGFSINSTGTSLFQNGPLLPPNDTYTIPIILRDAGGLTATHTANIQVTAGLITTFSLDLSNQTGGTYTGALDFEVDITYGGSPATSTPVTNLKANTTGSFSSSSDVKFATLNPPPVGTNTLTFDITRQSSGLPVSVPAGTLLSIEVYARGVSLATSPILSKIINVGTGISITTPISLNPSNNITGTDLTTNTSLGFDVNIELL